MITKYKVVLIGDAFVGKTSLVYRLCTNKFNEDGESTIGSSFNSYEVNDGENLIKLYIWDTAGQERFRSIIPVYLRDVDAILYVYDMSNINSIDSILKIWMPFVLQNAKNDYIPFIIGTKNDQSIITYGDLDNFKDITKFTTSSKTGEGVVSTFQTIAKILNESPIRERKLMDTFKLKHTEKKEECCLLL